VFGLLDVVEDATDGVLCWRGLDNDSGVLCTTKPLGPASLLNGCQGCCWVAEVGGLGGVGRPIANANIPAEPNLSSGTAIPF
jgi:hypothetical protein